MSWSTAGAASRMFLIKQRKSREDYFLVLPCKKTLQTLKDFVSKLQADEKLDDIEDGFICRSCVRLLERFRKVNEEVVCNVVKVLPVLKAAKSQREEVIP